MKRGTKCIAQTINLSNPETCIRPKRVQKLVSADVAQPCPSFGSGSSAYWSPRPVAVKVCTLKEMRRTCPPKLCDCPQKIVKPRTPMQKLRRALFLLLKGSVAAGLVYWTYADGFWGTSADTEYLYYSIVAVPNKPQAYDPRLPQLATMKHSLIECYNHAVFNTMNAVVGGTLSLQQRIKDALYPCEEATVERSDVDETTTSNGVTYDEGK